jgi:hypothetical protein
MACWLAVCLVAMTGGGRVASAGGPTDRGHVVGTLTRVDANSHRLILSRDTQIGSRVGERGPVNVYYDTPLVASPADGTASIAELAHGDRLLVEVRKVGARLQAGEIRVLATTTADHVWGSYLHGTVHEIRTGTRTLHVDEADSHIFNRIGYDAGTKVEALDGKPLDVLGLDGQEVDIALRRNERIPMASRIVVLGPATAH